MVKKKENFELKPAVDLEKMGSARLFLYKTHYMSRAPTTRLGYGTSSFINNQKSYSVKCRLWAITDILGYFFFF